MKTDLEIAQSSSMQPIIEIAAGIGLSRDDLVLHGDYVAKVPLSVRDRLAGNPEGKLVLVTAMTPTPRGEGKTTTTIGLGQALSRTGHKALIAIREPSLGPCMGVKGGAAGGGYSQVLPMEDINLHFTGDIHAVSIAHNLLSALVDNHLHQRGQPDIDSRNIAWKRVIDMNDRSLRSIVVGLGDGGRNGVMREDGFEITAASEVMAILCLADGPADLRARISRIVVGYDRMRKAVTAGDIGGSGAMAALLKHAVCPNLVQTIEGTPVLVHGGPFANIAHGCNSLIATRMALRLADFVVTEAGFGADLGAEKFFDIKCRVGALRPSASVLVVTRRAWQLHGIDNIRKHIENISRFDVPLVVSINRFADDPPGELLALQAQCRDSGVDAVITDFRESGGEGGLELAERVAELCENESRFRLLYDAKLPIREKVETIAREIYGADRVEFTSQAAGEIRQITDLGFGELPVCVAKTPLSLTDDPKRGGRPRGFAITVTSARVSAGAGFVVIYTGKVMTMPGLPKQPAALSIDIDDNGEITGLF